MFVAVFLQCRGTSGIFANNTAGLLDKGQKVAGKSSGLEIQNCLNRSIILVYSRQLFYNYMRLGAQEFASNV
ncbi:MAG: hypothetical protein WBE61_13685 [Nitrososphaeraceae archaeon]